MHLLVLVLQDVINVLGTFDVKLPTIQLYILYMTLLYSEHTHACTPVLCTHTHTHTHAHTHNRYAYTNTSNNFININAAI